MREIFVNLPIVLPIVEIVLAAVAWIYLYRRGSEVRELIFWGGIIFLIPILGPIVMFVYFHSIAKPRD